MKDLSNEVPVLVEISDPWDFVTKNGETREGVIRKIWGQQDRPNVIAIEMLIPLCQGDICVSLVYAYGRHSDGLAGLMGGGRVPCNFSDIFNETGAPSGAVTFFGALRLM